MKLKTLLKSKKALVLGLLSITLIAAISVGGTIAYFSGKDEIKNTLTIGRVDITVDEPNWKPENGENLKPGESAKKDPTVTAAAGESYMRVRMEIVDGDGVLLTDTDRINLILKTLWYDASPVSIEEGVKYSEAELSDLVAQKKLIAEYNTNAFAFAGIETGKPGVRYYNYIANDGIFSSKNEDTATLFTNVVIPKSWHNAELFILSGDTYEETENGSIEVLEKGTGYKLVITAEAIQSSGMENADAAYAELDHLIGITRDLSGIAE